MNKPAQVNQAHEPDAPAQGSLGRTVHGGKRVLVVIAGGIVLLIGLAMVVLPGPALLVIPAGLAILALEFDWARRLLQRMRSLLKRYRLGRWKRERTDEEKTTTKGDGGSH